MKKIIISLLLLTCLVAVPTGRAMAVDVFPECTADTADMSICKAAKTDKLFGPDSLWNRILNTFTYIIGAIAVLMIIVGGLRYVTSSGDPAQLTAAKNTILYSVIGLVIAASANAIINFVLINI